jgi:hypothetical protein
MTEPLKTVKLQLERCMEAFRRGELTEAHLRQVIDAIDASEKKRQDLLYLQAGGTSLASGVHGMLLVQDGQISEGPSDANDWPYKTVLDAIQDGWRVIKFPELALLMDESRTYGLGCEFILEKWR